MPDELFSVRMGITKKKKCMFGKDEELRGPYLIDTSEWITNTGSSTSSDIAWTLPQYQPEPVYAAWIGDGDDD